MELDYKMSCTEWSMFNHQKKLDKLIEQNRYYCKNCGHSVCISPKHTRHLCEYCGCWIFINNKEEFKFRLKEQMKRCL